MLAGVTMASPTPSSRRRANNCWKLPARAVAADTTLIANGLHPKLIAERLGHSSIKLTMDTYGHLFEESDRQASEQIDRLFGLKEARDVSRDNVIAIRKRRPL
jgi:integrase